MQASKENAREAMKELKTLPIAHDDSALTFLRDFLEAAEKRLPSQEVIDNDKTRKGRRKAVEDAAKEGFYGRKDKKTKGQG